MITKVQQYAKFIAAIIGSAVTAGSSLIPAEGLEWLTFIAAILTAVAVYAIPNATPAVKVAETGTLDLTGPAATTGTF